MFIYHVNVSALVYNRYSGVTCKGTSVTVRQPNKVKTTFKREKK